MVPVTTAYGKAEGSTTVRMPWTNSLLRYIVLMHFCLGQIASTIKQLHVYKTEKEAEDRLQ